jgi:hypothetical protein
VCVKGGDKVEKEFKFSCFGLYTVAIRVGEVLVHPTLGA